LRKRAENALGKNFDGNIDVRMWAAPKAYLNIVPLDFVVNAMSIISQKPAPLSKALQIFNIVNESPPSIETVHRILCKSLSIKDFRLVSKDAFVKHPMNPVERLFDRRITFQAPYARESVTFNCEKFRQAVSYSQLPIPQTGAGFLQDINKNFLAYHMRKLLSN
ncbi:MAG: hypothetical protein GY765_18265, partial [bacterium]|nr:hypothetical protein [bacterium]